MLEVPVDSRTRSPALSLSKYAKEGWLNARSGYFKKWKGRYARIEEHQYLCIYQSDNGDLINCVNKIDLTESKINYTLDNPKQFIINTNNSDNNFSEHYFECITVSKTNQWLTILKQISDKTKKNMNNNETVSDLYLVTPKPISSRVRVAIYDENEAKLCTQHKISNSQNANMEINDVYMKAVSLYQHKHYEESERVTRSVLNINPNHKQAVQLYKYLVDKGYNQSVNEQSKHKNGKRIYIQKRFRNFSSVGNYSKRKWMSFNRKSVGYNVSKKQIQKEIVMENEDEKKESLPRCQIEFHRFLKERVQISKYYTDLNDKFVSAKYDDIRFLKDFDKSILEKEIGLRPLHCRLFMRKIEIFMDEVKLFQAWLKQAVIKQKKNSYQQPFSETINDGIVDLFENSGIMTFEQLYRYIRRKRDLKNIITGDCDILWNEIQSIDRIEIEKGICNNQADEGGNNSNEGNEGSIVDTGHT